MGEPVAGINLSRSTLVTGSRRFVAFGVLAGLAVVVLRSYVSVDGEECRQAAGADRGTINLCGPIGPADLPALAVALLVALILFLPDLSELDIAGLVTLKRAVAEQKKETDQLRSLVQAISLRQETNITLYPRDLGEAADDVDRKSAAAGSGRLNGAITESDGSSRTDTSDSEVLHHPIDPTRAVAESTITRLWESIADKLGQHALAPRLNFGKRMIDDMPALEQWLALFGSDLEAFRAARNSVVHSPDTLSQDQLNQTVLLGQRLDRTLSDWLSGRRKVFTR